MKRIILIAALSVLATALGAQEFHSQWMIREKTAPAFLPVIGGGVLDLTEDGWEASIPVGRIPSGSYIEWDFTVTAKSDAPEYYAVEYFDKGRWMACDTLRCTLTDDTTKEYSIELRTFRLEDAIGRGNLQLRLRPVSSGDGSLRFSTGGNTAMSVRWMGTEPPRDTTRILCVGNSFTYVHNASWMLKEIAWSQGHYLDIQDALKGGQTFGQHLGLSVTKSKVREGGYEYVFLQNQSQTNAWYIRDRRKNASILDDAVALASLVREWSPEAELILEYTWAYPGNRNGGFTSFGEFDRLLRKGTGRMARSLGATVSPIGNAFAKCLSERPDIPMFGADGKHQSDYGAYLKACVNYLMLFHEPFSGEVQSCSLDPEKTQYLRDLVAKAAL